jgi:hypothetical protein
MALFGFGKPKPAQLCVYGKLPLARDYLRVGGGEGAALAWRAWLDQTFSTGNVDRNAGSFPWPMRFILGAERSGEPLLGAVWNSTDTGGERVFPFSVFAECAQKLLRESLAEGLEGVADYWRQFDSAYLAHEDCSDASSFLEAMRDRTCLVNEDAPEQTPFAGEGWAAALWPEHGVKGLALVLGDLQKLAQRDYSDPVRLPLVADLAMPAQVAAWMEVLESAGLVDAKRIPTMFFPRTMLRGDEPAYLTVLRKPLGSDSLTWLGSALVPLPSAQGDFCGSQPRRREESNWRGESDGPLVRSVRRLIRGLDKQS